MIAEEAAARRSGPGEIFERYPAVYALSVSGAGTAAGVFVARATRSRGARRVGWILLAALEALIFVGIFIAREDVTRRASAS